MRRRWFMLLMAWAFLLPGLPVDAHANLVRSIPAANEHLQAAPDEIRLCFSEPIEPHFSRIELRDPQGSLLDTPPAQVDPEDGAQFALKPGPLPDGVYTVAWRAISQTDGHPTQGNFPLVIGAATPIPQAASAVPDDSIPAVSAAIRWLNLLSLALMTGSAAFWWFVWQPSVPGGSPAIEARMRRVIWLGWLAVAITSSLVVLLQTSIASGGGFDQAAGSVLQVIQGTRFGSLWLARLLLWLLFGIVLRLGEPRSGRTYTLLLMISGALLATQSLFSHASGSVDPAPAVIADWAHLLAMSLWIGGLAQFWVVIGPIRQLPTILGGMAARFTNMARAAVAVLVVTGLYAAWLQVGSWEALFTTPYGRALVVKLLLFVPLLGIAAINLLFTSRGLRSGQTVWSQRLRVFASLEVVLAVSILAAVGVMTALEPARITAARAAVPPPEDHTFLQMNIKDGLMVHLTIEPGMVGENTFYVDLYDQQTGQAIEDASLIRLRLESEDHSIGESELRPQLDADGRYAISGSNLSLPGGWRARLTIQRPGQFDTVVDFQPTITARSSLPEPGYNPTVDRRVVALVLTGFAGIVVSGLALLLARPIGRNPQTLLAAVFLAGSLMIWMSGVLLLNAAPPM